jgi:hypothetical protein
VAASTRRLYKELRALRLYAFAITAAFGVLALAAFRRARSDARFDTITAERINVVEPDGTVRLVISGHARSPGQVMHGRRFAPDGERRAGLTFYNDRGDESGGLAVGGRRDRGQVAAGAGLMFDQFEQDQVMALEYAEKGGRRQQGLTVLDRPEVPLDTLIARDEAIRRLPAGAARDSAVRRFVADQGGVAWGAPRLFAGRDRSRAAVVRLADKYGRSRLRLVVDSLGAAAVEFLNDSGRVTYRLGDSSAPHPTPKINALTSRFSGGSSLVSGFCPASLGGGHPHQAASTG